MIDMPIHGVILAGGRSSRMGTDKALLEIGGKTMLLRLAEQLVKHCSKVVVASGDGRQEDAYREALGPAADRVRFVRDRFPDCGPLAGLHASLSALPEGYAFVMACDMPVISEPLLERMREQAAAGPDVVRTPDQPFHALYHTRTAAVLERLLEQGEYRMMRALSQLGAVTVEPEQGGETEAVSVNLNTPEAFERYSEPPSAFGKDEVKNLNSKEEAVDPDSKGK
jgi:molybdopterin-guanine dinucleotide biosynthesis protein A